MNVLAIQRAKRFSPNSIEKDRAILEAVADRLSQWGNNVFFVDEENLLTDTPSCDAIITMGRLPKTISWLKTLKGVQIINTPQSVGNCSRSVLQGIMQAIGTPMPPAEGEEGYWLKRGDSAAQSEYDVQFAASTEELTEKIALFKTMGITDYTISAHVAGDLVKFYGVRGSDFFRFFYPTDDGLSKFNDEQHNGKAHHYTFDVSQLFNVTDTLAKATGLQVYGGDCIVKADGSFCVIDFNDWPSFSRCLEAAADAIAGLVINGTKIRDGNF